MRLEITQWDRNDPRACRYHTRECHIQMHTCQNYSRVSGNHTLHLKSHSACWNHTRACWNLICAFLNHTACRNYTLRVGITLVSVIFTRMRFNRTLVCVESTLCVWKSYYGQKPILCVLNSHSCVLKLHSACRNYTLRVEITPKRVVITLKRVKITLLCVEIHTLRIKSHCAGGNHSCACWNHTRA
jgi:hypothetical protein